AGNASPHTSWRFFMSLRLLPLLPFVFLSCAAAAQEIVGKMGTVELHASEIKSILDAQPPEARRRLAADSAQLERLVKTELARRAVLAEARQKGWDKRPELQPLMERAREDVVIGSYVSSVAKPADGYPSEEELKQFYESNKAQLQAPPQYQIAQIFLPAPEGTDKAKADEAAKKINDLSARLTKSAGDFGKLAKENSAHKESAEKGGEIGWVSEDQMVAEIRRAVVKMNKGDISPPVKSAAGWHLIRLIDKKPPALRPLSEVRGKLVSAMRQRKMQEGERVYLEALSTKTRPTINQIELNKIQEALK
ncbi:MAG: peptidylprolyl isomerase, partial [Pseudomonadota bacterium]